MPARGIDLANSFFFRGLGEELAGGLSALAHTVALRPGEALFHEGDEPDGFYAVIDGTLKVTTASREGQERLIAILGPGEIVGEMGVIDGKPRSASATALKTCRLAFVRSAEFERFAAERPQIYRSMLASLSQRLRLANEAGAANVFLPIEGRLARALVRLAESFGEPLPGGGTLIHYRITQSDMGAMCGAARENVCRVLSEWRKEGLVSKVGGFYRLNDEPRLRLHAELVGGPPAARG